MARANKQTVDYFPHLVNHGKTIYILENNFGNDGYAFWFKLLELLGAADGHFIDCNNASDWQFLLAKTRVNEEIATKILNILADLETIDKELWQNKIIWSDNFIKNIEDAYARRTISVPIKADVVDLCKHKYGSQWVSVNINTQSKVDKSKAEESKVKESKHKHGEYKNILLTDKELEHLNSEYGQEKTNQAIEFLSVYKAEKDYKTKSDNLTLRRWVFKAIQERNRGSPNDIQGRVEDYMNKYG